MHHIDHCGGRGDAPRDLIATAPGGIASRVLAKNAARRLAPVRVRRRSRVQRAHHPFRCAGAARCTGALTLTIGGEAVAAVPGTIVRLPANVPHAVDATVASRMLLIMLREPKAD